MTLASEGLSLPDRMDTRRMDGPAPPQLPDGVTVDVEHDFDDGADAGVVHNPDGSITVNDPPKKKTKKNVDFDANLAEEIDEDDPTILNTIAADLLEAIEADLSSRKEWEDTFNKGVDLLGLKIESSSSDVTGGGNISRVKDPLLLEAVLRYQSNFNAEMLPADGPVKVRDDKTASLRPASPDASPGMGHNGGPPMGGAPPPPAPMGVQPGGPMGGTAPPPPPPGALSGAVMRSDLAEALQKDFNHYLTVIDKPYYADTDRMSFSQGLGGLAFKKIYRDPLENRPISRFVMANHIIVNNGASSLHDAKRITHETPAMSQITMKRMMLKGIYRDVELSLPTSAPSSVDAKIKETEGRQATDNTRPEDRDYVVYECYCYLDLEGYEHLDEDDEPTGLPLPYRVTIEKDSKEILEIRRDWKEGDEDHKRRRHFVKYPMFPGLGFYDYGYVHILGNQTRVLSAIASLMVDGGMFSNFPGGLIDKMAARQEKNQIRPGPGGFLPIDTGGRPIQQVVMGMPYKDISPALMQLASAMEANGRKLGSIAELPLGEGRGDVPVGTVIALVEQSTKLLSAVHKRNHAAQQEEFEILKELFMEDPEALSRFSENPAHKWESEAEFKDINLVPASDPNVASHIMRIARAQAVVQMAQQAPPGLFNPKEVATRALRVLGEEDIDSLFLPPQPPGGGAPSPHMIDAQSKAAALKQKAQSDAQNNASKIQMQQLEMQDHAADRASKEQIERERLSQQAMKDARDFASDVTPPDSLLPPDFGGRPSFGP